MEVQFESPEQLRAFQRMQASHPEAVGRLLDQGGRLEVRVAEFEAKMEGVRNGVCALSGPGRGDCEHSVGLPGVSIPGQHDGPDGTVDCYGTPNGWCQRCWDIRQLSELQARVSELEAGIRNLRDVRVINVDAAYNELIDLLLDQRGQVERKSQCPACSGKGSVIGVEGVSGAYGMGGSSECQVDCPECAPGQPEEVGP